MIGECVEHARRLGFFESARTTADKEMPRDVRNVRP
jgi:hypothetical protein